MTVRKLLVIVPDRISTILDKGEYSARYYNPGDFFEEVHLLLINNDHPDSQALQKTVGRARLTVHNLPFTPKDYLRSMLMRPNLLMAWARPAVDLARTIQPDLIRCHGQGLNAFAAYTIKRALGIPYVVSIHNNPDEVIRGARFSLKNRLIRQSMEGIQKKALQGADRVVAVYQSQGSFLRRMGVTNYEVIYNVINPEKIREKQSYALHTPVRLISVGRHFEAKNPVEIIRALADIPEAFLTLIGDGPIQAMLEQAAADSGVEDRVRFIRWLSNDKICELLPDQDIFVIHVENEGISKTALEAFLTGMPSIINRRVGVEVPELQGDHVMLVENSSSGYEEGIRALITEDTKRERLGRSALAYAQKNWSPAVTEARYVEVYRRLLKST